MTMPRLLVHVEGETEETFVNELLAPYLLTLGFSRVGARLLGNARQRDRRGGIRGWSTVRTDILRHLKEDHGAVSTLLVDYYALPKSGTRAWPGRAQAASRPFSQKAMTVQNALVADLTTHLGYSPQRFVPFVIMHEFEGLLFSNCAAFAAGIGMASLAPAFQQIRDQFSSPEQINDSPDTAPSKRVLALMPRYAKPLHGTLAAMEIGLDAIRSECPNFAHWLARLKVAA
jgi:hypothetical protein